MRESTRVGDDRFDTRDPANLTIRMATNPALVPIAAEGVELSLLLGAGRADVQRLAEEGLDGNPRRGMSQRPEPDQGAGLLVSGAGRETGLLEAMHLHPRALAASGAVVVRVDAEATALHRPDREPVWRERRPGLGGQRGVRNKAGADCAGRNARVCRPCSIVTYRLRCPRPASARHRPPPLVDRPPPKPHPSRLSAVARVSDRPVSYNRTFV